MTTMELLADLHTRDRGASGQAGVNPATKHEPGAFDANGLFLFVKNPSPDELEEIHSLAVSEIPGIASLDVVKSVYGHNPVSFWAFMRSTLAIPTLRTWRQAIASRRLSIYGRSWRTGRPTSEAS
jgi:hypothetical protein